MALQVRRCIAVKYFSCLRICISQMGPKLCQTASHQQLWTMASHDRGRNVRSHSVLPWHDVVRRYIITGLPLRQEGSGWGKKRARKSTFFTNMEKFSFTRYHRRVRQLFFSQLKLIRVCMRVWQGREISWDIATWFIEFSVSALF